jgi:membrane protein implicated in regulation of membrane protease activity
VERVRNEISKSLSGVRERVTRVEVHLSDQNADEGCNEFVISRTTPSCAAGIPARYLRGNRFGREAASMPWVAWLIGAVALAVAEYFTLTLAFGLLAAAALVAAIVAGMGGPVLAQVLAFAIAGAVGLLIVRPIARRQMTHPSLVREGSYALVGKKAVVIEEVSGTQGLIKLAGEVWSARALDEDDVIPAGTQVDVMEIDGATAIVYPRELLP